MKLRYFFLSILLIFGFFAISRVYYHLTDDFRMGNITYEFDDIPHLNIPPLSREEESQLNQILNQQFTYIGKGAQSYVFGSNDQKYVIKFFKFKHLKPSPLLKLLPSISPFDQYKKKVLARKQRKLISVFTGYELAYKVSKDNAGLIYLHLQPTTHFNKEIELIDKMGLIRKINLDQVVFLVQKKGETARTYIGRLLENNALNDAQVAFSQIIGMYMSEYKDGVYDRDHGVMHNTGFVDGKPFHLDVGFLTADAAMKTVDVYKEDLAYVIWKMEKWIQLSFPQFIDPLSSHLRTLFYKNTGFIYDPNQVDPKFHKRKKD